MNLKYMLLSKIKKLLHEYTLWFFILSHYLIVHYGFIFRFVNNAELETRFQCILFIARRGQTYSRKIM